MIAKLGDLCEFLNGGTPSKDQPHYFEGNIPWITSADITGTLADTARSFITEAAIQQSATNKVAKGTVLLVTRTGVGKVAIAGQDLCFSQDITGLKPDKEKLDAGYLVHFLRTKQTHFERLARGATIKGITRDVVTDLAVPLPSIPEQRRISALLDQADELRTKRREALAQLDSLAESTFVDIFGDPFSNPKQWATKPLGELLESITNGANADQTDSDLGWPITRIETIWNGTIDSARVKYVAPSKGLKERYQLQVGDILFSHINSPEHIAKTAIYQGDPSLMIHGINLLRLRCSSNEVDAHWLLHLLKQRSVRAYFRTRCKKAVNQASLNQQDIKSLICIVPPLELQAIFSERVEAANIHRLLHEKSAIELDKLFQSLQQRAFRGEL